MEICVNNSALSETQLPYHSDSDERIVVEIISKEDNFVKNISINSFLCEKTVCEIIIFAHSFYKDFLSPVSSSSKELEKSCSMYGAFNPAENIHYHNGNVKYYSPTDLSKICRQNIDFPSIRENESLKVNNESAEQARPRKHHEEEIEEKSRKKSHKDKKKYKRESKEGTSYGAYCTMTNQEDVGRRRKKSKKYKKKEFSELDYYDLQCLINDCNKDIDNSPNIKKERRSERKTHQRSQSIDQIPTKDVTSEQMILRRSERPMSAERREIKRPEKNREYCMKYYLPSTPSNSFQMHEQQHQQFMTPNQLNCNEYSSKTNKTKSRNKKKTPPALEIPEFVTLDQINEQTMNIKDERFHHHKHYRWETEKEVRHHQQREFYGEYNQQQYQYNLDSHNNQQDFNPFTTNPVEYNKTMQDNYQPTVNEAYMKRTKTKERKKEKHKEHRKKASDKEYKALKKYMKKLAKEQKKATKDNIEPNYDERVDRDRRYLEENLLNFDTEFNQNYVLRNNYSTCGCKHATKEFIPLDLGLDELQIPTKPHRKKHEHKRSKNKKETMKTESSERIRSASLSVKRKHKNLNDMLKKYDELFDGEQADSKVTKSKSETSLNSTFNDKNIVCIYPNKKEKEDTNTIKLTKKRECLSVETEKANKYNKNGMKECKVKKEKEHSPYDNNQMVFQTEHNKQMSDVLKMQERSLFFQEAMRKDFPSRPRPRLSRSRQRSSRYLAKLEDAQYSNNLEVDEKPTKDVHCYDVGTSTILDNNFGDVLELLKGEPSIKLPCSNKKRSVFHVKKKASREDLVESTRKACDDGDQTLGIVVKGIEPPKKIETNKVRSRFKFPSERKINRLECKILSVVAIAPSKMNQNPDLEQNPMKTQSTPLMQHVTIAEKRNSDKRLERLLKYYKVDAQSKMSNQTKTSQKSMKAIIANKLSDYLKKLQEDDNDDMLQIQTDDPKVVKLILPIDLTAFECSNSSVIEIKGNGQEAEKPKESFSDLYINYSADNTNEGDDDSNSFELSELENRRRVMENDETHLNNLIYNQSLDLKSHERKSTIFLNQSALNYSRMEKRIDFPVSPKTTGNIDRNSFEVMKQFQPNSENSPSFNMAEGNWNHISKNEQSFVRKQEKENKEYKNSIQTNIQRNCSKINENEMRNTQTMKESHPTLAKGRTNEKMSLETTQPNQNDQNKFQIEQKNNKKSHNIVGIKSERKVPAKVCNGMLACKYEQIASVNGGFQKIRSNSEFPTEHNNEKINHSIDNSSIKPPKQAPSETMHQQRCKQRENERSSRINTKIPGIHNEYENEQIGDTLYAENFDSQEKMRTGRTITSQAQKKPVENSRPTRGYEYFEIPLPKPMKKPRSVVRRDFEEYNNNTNFPSIFKPECQAESPLVEPRSSKNSQIPKRITNISRNIENPEEIFPSRSPQNDETDKQPKRERDESYDELYETPAWNYQKGGPSMDNSLEKCIHWNIRNSETVVISEFNDSAQNRTSETAKSTSIVPRKSHIPVARKDQHKFQTNQERSPCVGNENNTTMFLTKSYKVPPGQSSYERRKIYDTRIRKNVKRRSLSESSGQTKTLPLIYEVRYCNVYNQCLPHAFDLGGSRSDQNLSNFSKDFDMTNFKRSIESLTTVPSCYLKESQYRKDEPVPSTEPSCLLKESAYGQNIDKDPMCPSTEPSCLLKASKYDLTSRKEYDIVRHLPEKNNVFAEENFNKHSLKNGRIKELIKENLLYSNYPTANKKPKTATGTRKRRKKVEKDKILPKTKITLRCSKKSPRENIKHLKIVAKLKENRNNKDEETSANRSPQFQCQNLTDLSLDKVTENELCVSFEKQKLSSVVSEAVFVEKSVLHSPSDSQFSNDKDSSVSNKSTLVNCEACSSITSGESEKTVKEREVFVSSAGDSGYLTKEAEKNRSETIFDSKNEGEARCSNIFEAFSSKQQDEKCGIPRCKQTTTEKISNWNQKDLAKLRVQLLFPHVYDDFELLEKAHNTDLIKYYVESQNDKLKEAIDSISQKETMSIKSRSVISLPSVKMIPEERSLNGDVASEYSCKSREGGYYNYQKFIAQNNECYSTNVLSKLNKPGVCGDCADTFEEDDLSETCSVKSCNVPSAKSSVTMKKSLIELFKPRPSSAKKSSSSMLSDSDTLVEENGEECLSMHNNISDEEFLNNFHQIMAIECQRYAKKVRDQSKSNENIENDLEYEEIPLDCLLKNKNLRVESSEEYLEQEFELASDKICSEKNDTDECIKKESNESFKSLTCIKPKRSNSKWQNIRKKQSSPGSKTKFNLDFYPQEKMSILDMIKCVQESSVSEDSLICSPRDKVLSVISSGEVTKQSEKLFFDNLLAFYDKESEFIKKLIRDDEFFSTLIENIRNSEDTTKLIFRKDVQKKVKKEKKRGILSRFFRWKEKKSTETLFENPSIVKSMEFAKSMSYESSSITRGSCYSFYKDFEDLEKDINEAKRPNSQHLQQLAYKAKCHLEPMVKATISNRHISDKIKLAGFLKMLDMVAKGDFTFLNNGDNKTLEEKLREHVAQMFEKVYQIANREVAQKNTILDHDKIQLLKTLVTKYHMGIETHINILAIYIGRGLIVARTQLEDAIIHLMGQDSLEINFEQLEKICSIQSG